MHDTALILTLSVGLAVALVLGLLTQWLRLSPIVGYLLAGVAIGPHTPGFVGDVGIAKQLAEIGIVLLMFGVGLHFQLRDLLAVWRIAVPGAVGQSLVATGLGALLAVGIGWPLGPGLVLGIGISVASTVVLIRVLLDNGQLDSPQGHVAVGWLVVEDLFTVLVLVCLPAVAQAGRDGSAGAAPLATALGIAALKVVGLGALVLLGGGRTIPRLLAWVAATRSRELFTLTVLVLALCIAATAAWLFGVSMALGAFLAGMVVGQSAVSHQAAADALPMRDAFAVLFFVSVGMLFDWHIVLDAPALVAGTLGIILVAKPVVALALVVAFGHSLRTALTVAVGLAQIGEFSFILATLGRELGVLPAAGYDALVAGALGSITLNPALFRALPPLERWVQGRPRLWALLHRRAEARVRIANDRTALRVAMDGHDAHAVVVGYGPVGQTLTRLLREFGLRPVVIDLNIDTITRLTAEGHVAIYGDAGRAEILAAAGIDRARYLLLTLPDLVSRIPVIIAAREANPALKILVRARYLGERSMLEEIGATAVCYEEAEAAVALADYLLREVGADPPRIEAEARKIRDALAIRESEWLVRPALRRRPSGRHDPPAP